MYRAPTAARNRRRALHGKTKDGGPFEEAESGAAVLRPYKGKIENAALSRLRV